MRRPPGRLYIFCATLMRTAQTTNLDLWEASPYLPQSWQTQPIPGAEPCPPPSAPGPRQLLSHGEVRRKQLSNPSILQMIRNKPEPLRRNKYKCFFRAIRILECLFCSLSLRTWLFGMRTLCIGHDGERSILLVAGMKDGEIRPEESAFVS